MTPTGETTPAADSGLYPEREFRFTRRDFKQIAGMLYTDAGIHLGEMKAPMVYSRLVKRLRALGLESFKRYCELVEAVDGADERRRMMVELTTNVTSFLREPHHFQHMKARLLPGLLEEARKGGRLRIWSAGCSSGEEPYSIALSILELMPDAPHFDIKVLATDINAQVLAHGARGEYDEVALAPLSRQMVADWFVSERRADGRKAWRVGEALASLVAFRQLNLLAPWPMKMRYHAIFCRNVLIYFDDAGRSETWRRMATLLAPEGRLYVGASERVRGVDGVFRSDGYTIYRLRKPADA